MERERDGSLAEHTVSYPEGEHLCVPSFEQADGIWRSSYRRVEAKTGL